MSQEVVKSKRCSKCNTGIGLFNDSPELLITAAGYVGYDRGYSITKGGSCND